MTRLSVLFATLFATLVLSVYAKAPKISNTVYLIRHGEKPDDGGRGLNTEGKRRAQCLTNVFNPRSGYDIGYIMAQKPKKDGHRARPRDTVIPLAKELGLEVDTSCGRNNPDCVTDAIEKFAKHSSKDILICWQHTALTDIVEALGVKHAPDYPDDSFDVIWEVVDQQLVSETSEDCPGLDFTEVL